MIAEIDRTRPLVISWGEPLIGVYPLSGCAAENSATLAKTHGGDASNFALATAKLGHRTAMLTAVGADSFGRSFQELWSAAGVDTSLVQIDNEHHTGVYFVSFRGDKHEMTYYRDDSAACFLDLKKIDWEAFASAKVLHVTGLSQAISRRAMEASFELLAFARSNGITVSYDVNYRPAVWHCPELARAVITYTVENYVDLLEVTDEEMAELGWGDRPDAIRSAFRRPPALCAVKLGARGSILSNDSTSLSFPAIPIEVEDTVGAGDAYDAGLVTGLLEGASIREMGRLATGAAAMVCRAMGPIEGQPTRNTLEDFISGT